MVKMSCGHQSFQEELTKRIFQIEWAEKFQELNSLLGNIDSCNDEEKSKILRELGVISGEFKPNF